MAQQPIEGDQYEFEFPDEETNAITVQKWKMYFDGAVNYRGAGIGVIVVTPEGEMLPLAKRLMFPVTNNMAEYEACIFGIETLVALGARGVEVYGDSMLVVRQTQGEWELREDKLKPYQAHLKTMAKGLPDCSFQHLPREDNKMDDALATLASAWEDQGRLSMRPLILTTASKPCHDAREVMDTEIDDGKPWYYDIQNYLE